MVTATRDRSGLSKHNLNWKILGGHGVGQGDFSLSLPGPPTVGEVAYYFAYFAYLIRLPSPQLQNVNS